MTPRLALSALALTATLSLGSCQYSLRYVFANNSAVAVSLTYRLRPDTSDVCAQCRQGFWRLSVPTWVVQDSLRPKDHHLLLALPSEYIVTRDGQEVIFRLTVPPGGKVQIYEHSGSDEFQGIPFRLVSLEAVSVEQRLVAEGEVLKTLFRKDSSHGYILAIPGKAAA